jgi:hypothetical protein
VPRHYLCNGRLNQTAYSLFLFMRDLAGGDIVGWVDQRLEAVDLNRGSDREVQLRQVLLEPLGHIYGVSNKVLAMALSDLLLAGDAKRPAWIEAGTVMIAIDTLVHNFLHRTGILRQLDADHAYGPAAIDQAAVRTSSSGSPPRSMRAASIAPSRRISRGLCSSRSGDSEPN